MSSLHKAIRFRQSISKLNDQEFTTFFSKLCESYDKRNVLTMSLFHLSLYQTKQNNDVMADHMNTAITTIIESRSTDKAKTLSVSKCNKASFDTCASSLLSLISSYLHLSQFIHFILTNRNIYISVSSTAASITTIHRTLWLYRFKNNYGYSSFEKENQIQSLRRFKMVKNIELTAPTIIDLQSKERYPQCLHGLWRHLHTLTVGSFEFPTHGTLMDTLQSLKFNHLTLRRLDMNLCDSFNPLIQLIGGLNSCGVTQLSLYNVQTQMMRMQTADNYHMLQLNTKRRLNGLCLYQVSSQFNHDLISIIGEHLESLHVVSDEVNERLPENTAADRGKTYGKLKELCVYNVAPQSIQYVLRHADQLQRLHLSALDDYDWNHVMEILMETFRYNIQLEYIAVEIAYTANELELLISAFVECLEREDFVERNVFKLRFNFDIDDAMMNYFTANLMKILTALKEKIHHFALVLAASWVKGALFARLEAYIQQMKVEHASDYDVIIGTEYVSVDEALANDDTNEESGQCWIRHVTISNKNCSMCAFNEAWIMDCDNCQQFVSNR